MNLITVFGEIKRIYGFCPCCGELFRLSDAMIFSDRPPPQTEFDRVAAASQCLERRNDRFDEQEEAIRERARQQGQRAALRLLRRLAPLFTDHRIKLRDMKVLFHPVDYVVFTGMSQSRCGAVLFMDHPPESSRRERLQRSLRSAIRAGNIDWQTLRIGPEFRVVRDEARES